MDKLQQAVEEYKSGTISITQLCKKYHMTGRTLSKELKRQGIEVVNKQNEVKFNQDVFKNIDTEDKAYWLGFIFADGYIGSNRNDFEISLQEEDKEHLLKFNDFMEYDGLNVKERAINLKGKEYKAYRWSAKNKKLHEDLEDKGCIPKKSLVLKFPNIEIFSSKDLVRHFIRGYFDGDGCITYKDKEHTTVCISVLGTSEFLNELQKNANISYKLSNNNKKSDITKKFNIVGHPALDFLDYIYKDATIYLDRKYQKYLEFCRLYKKL
jgi:intein/homing endonuclease